MNESNKRKLSYMAVPPAARVFQGAKIARTAIVLCLSLPFTLRAQHARKFDLSRLFVEQKLFINPRSSAKVLKDSTYRGLTCDGIVWLTGVNLSTGSIDIDLKGRDVFQQSFLGIAFHGVDSVTYDAVYFRPFNFQSADSLRHKHMVQYISEPDFPWDRLRKEHPLVYENTVNPIVTAKNWFHAHIVVTNETITVYVNYSAIPSLTVKKLDHRADGLVGLWDDGLPGDFANLVVTGNP